MLQVGWLEKKCDITAMMECPPEGAAMQAPQPAIYSIYHIRFSTKSKLIAAVMQLDALIDAEMRPKLCFYCLPFKREDAEDTGQGRQKEPSRIIFSLLSLSSQSAGPYLPEMKQVAGEV